MRNANLLVSLSRQIKDASPGAITVENTEESESPGILRMKTRIMGSINVVNEGSEDEDHDSQSSPGRRKGSKPTKMMSLSQKHKI